MPGWAKHGMQLRQFKSGYAGEAVHTKRYCYTHRLVESPSALQTVRAVERGVHGVATPGPGPKRGPDTNCYKVLQDMK